MSFMPDSDLYDPFPNHTVAITTDPGTGRPRITFTCHEDDAAGCHRYPDCECDSTCEHPPTVHAQCWMQDWFDNDAIEPSVENLDDHELVEPGMSGAIVYAHREHYLEWGFVGAPRRDHYESAEAAYALGSWSQSYGIALLAGDPGRYTIWGHPDARLAVAAVARDARMKGPRQRDQLRMFGLAGLLAGLTRRWAHNPTGDLYSDIRWDWCGPDTEGAVPMTVIDALPGNAAPRDAASGCIPATESIGSLTV